MPNIENIIAAKNKDILRRNLPHTQVKELQCNCRVKTECPLRGRCRESSMVYRAVVETDNTTASYVGLTDNQFKVRLANHKQSFQKEKLKNATELSKYIWGLKEANIDFNIKWEIVDKATSYSNCTKRCKLCLLEKYYIICCNKLGTLNKKSELVNTCRHARKYLLSSIAT